jgi:hypothetical protein
VTGSVADLIGSSRSTWNSLRGEGIEWTHSSRSIQASFAMLDKEWAARGEGETPPSLEYAAATRGRDAPPTEVLLRDWRMWISSNGQLRFEYGTGAWTATTVMDGERWWSWWPSTGLISNANGEETTTWRGPADPLVYPERLPRSLDLQALGRIEAAQRAALHVRAVPKPGVDLRPDFSTFTSEADFERYRETYPPAHWGLGVAADEYELSIDEASGIVLRSEARHKRRPFHIVEMRRLVLDEPVSEDLFSLREGRDF